jgi:chromosome partitioning protein
MRRVVFTQKGGVGKSSIACNLAAISAQQGLRTLVLDLDVQGNATQYLLQKPTSELRDTVEALFEQSLSINFLSKKGPESYVHPTRFANLSMIPAGAGLDYLAGKLEARQKVYKLREALKALGRSFDRIYIDTPPAINFYTRSALISAERCLVPFDCDSFSRQALYQVLETIAELQEDHNPSLAVEGIVVNQFQPQAKLPRRFMAELIDEGLPVLPCYLGASVKMRESHDQHEPLVHLAPTHKLTLQFIELFEVIEGRGGKQRAAS